MSAEDNGRRAILTADDSDGGFAVWITREDECPVSAPLPAGVSHLLAADDALMPGRWGAHTTLCGLEVRRPNAPAAEGTSGDPHSDSFRYCPEWVREAARWSAEAGDPASTVR